MLCKLQEIEETEELKTQSEILKQMTRSLINNKDKSYIKEIKKINKENVIKDFIEYTETKKLTFEESEILRKYTAFLIERA